MFKVGDIVTVNDRQGKIISIKKTDPANIRFIVSLSIEKIWSWSSINDIVSCKISQLGDK